MMQHPEVTQFEEEVRKGRRAILDGLLNFLLSSLVYSTFSWFILRALEQNDVISFKFNWKEITSIVCAAQFVRIWDRAFMRR